MSYTTISICAHDAHLMERVSACVAQEGYTGNPEAFTPSIIWQIAGKSDIEAAYAYALQTDNPDPGGDPTVITDQMILSATQPLVQAVPPA